jgi:hypothetical protein
MDAAAPIHPNAPTDGAAPRRGRGDPAAIGAGETGPGNDSGGAIVPQSQSSPTARTRTPTWVEETASRAARSFAAGVAYFLAIAAAGWLFGPVRAIVIRHGAPAYWTTLFEAFALALLLAAAAAAAIRTFRVRERAGDRLLVGSVGVTLLVAAEFIDGALVRGWGVYETLSDLTPQSGGVFIVVLLVLLVLPLIEPAGRAEPR